MFRSRAGFCGCCFLRNGADCIVVTLWETPDHAAALEVSDRYRDTVAAIMAAAFIRSADEALVGAIVS
jgi:CHAT domain-containing protein